MLNRLQFWNFDHQIICGTICKLKRAKLLKCVWTCTRNMAPQWLVLRYNSYFISWSLSVYHDLSCIFFSFLITPSLFSVGIRLRIWQWWVSCKCSWYLAISQSEARPCFEDPPTFNSTEKNSMISHPVFVFCYKWHTWKKMKRLFLPT
jgi:hypothetical protein